VSVIMMLRIAGDPAELESFAQENGDMLMRITEDSKAKGAVHHRFLGGDGEIVVIDEWPSQEAFQSFFDAQEEIPKVIQAVAKGEPEVTFLQPLDTPDAF
jgi:quinol monooxygenase YgiN